MISNKLNNTFDTLPSEAGEKREITKVSDQISNVHWHLDDLRVVELLNVLKHTRIISRHEVDGNTLTTETTTTTNPTQTKDKP